MEEQKIRRVAVVGTGLIGASWTAFFLSRGLDVIATDVAPHAEAALRSFTDRAWPALAEIGLSTGASRERLTFSRNLAGAVEGVDFVQESGPEQEDFKIKTFAALDASLPAGTILASSSSGLRMSAIQSACKNPERCVIGHPLNPPHLMPLVEVVGGEKTSQETIERARQFYCSLGKRTIHVRKEVDGFVTNRLQAALWREIFYLLSEGIAGIAEVDDAVCWGLGLRWGLMGPGLLAHLGGGSGGIHHFIEHLFEPLTTWWTNVDPVLTPELKKKIEEEVIRAAGARSIGELEHARDTGLLRLLEIRASDEQQLSTNGS